MGRDFDRAYLYPDDIEEAYLPGPIPGKIPVTARIAPPPGLAQPPLDAAAVWGGIMRRRESGGSIEDGAEARVASAAGSAGQPLPEALRERFESSLDADLSGVRVHTGAESQAAAQAVGAKAYAVGQDIHFGAGQYQPATAEGQHLLAHEVAHTVQQAGGASGWQPKLEIGSATDPAELEADRAADAMVAGRSAQVVVSAASVAPKLLRLQDSNAVRQAGDSAEAAGWGATLSVDSASVTMDRTRVGELIAKIDAQKDLLKEANKPDTFDTVKGDVLLAISTNAATRALLEIFDDSLQTSHLDTKAFAVQFRIANADYQRLQAEANVLAGEKLGAAGMQLDSSMAEFNAFRTARKDLNSAAERMEGKLSTLRGAASKLQGALYEARAAAAQAKADKAKSKLASIRQEIAAAAAGVGKIVKLASGVAGLAGGSGAVSGLGKKEADVSDTTVERSPDNIFENPHHGHYVPQDVHVNPEVGTKAELMAKAELIGAMGKDAAGLAGLDAAGIAEKVVTAVGEYAEQDKIKGLQAQIAEEEAINDTFKAAAASKNMSGHVDTMKGAASELNTQVKAFEGAKQEMTRARDALMAALEKKGGKGKQQAKAVLFLSDADKFLAQAKNAIAVGKHQQTNLKDAAERRKGLRGTSDTLEGTHRETKTYYTCKKTTSEGTLWGKNDHYQLTKVDVELGGTGNMESPNELVQGGQGNVEGVGGAGDVVARQIKTLEENEKQAKVMQANVQNALGVGAPGVNG
jgi:hypothetical protein